MSFQIGVGIIGFGSDRIRSDPISISLFDPIRFDSLIKLDPIRFDNYRIGSDLFDPIRILNESDKSDLITNSNPIENPIVDSI